MEYEFKPIVKWPTEKTPSYKQKRALFSTTHEATLVQLESELKHLRAAQVVFQVDAPENQIRRDGMLRADARVNGPGVILSFNSKFGPQSYPCDTYKTWQDNLRAITLALEALRKIDRYGVTKRGEQYTGWKALPAPKARTELDAIKFFEDHSGLPSRLFMQSQEALRALYLDLAKKFHPDLGGTEELMYALNDYYTLLASRPYGS